MTLEDIILYNLYNNDYFAKRALPYIEEDFFNSSKTGSYEKILFRIIREFINNHKSLPTKEAIVIELQEKGFEENEYNHVQSKLTSIEGVHSTYDDEWLIEKTEKWCKQQKLYNALHESVLLYDKEKRKNENYGEILENMKEALGFSFDDSVGHNYLNDGVLRWEYYHRKEFKIPFDLEMFNKATKGGVSRKTLNLYLAGTNVGKTFAMCHNAAHNLASGFNVLYITLEISEEEVSKRIDANLMNLSMDDVLELQQDIFLEKLEHIKKNTPGNLIVKEFPTYGASVTHFNNLIQEIELKRGFKPDIIYIDYLGICASARMKDASNSYAYFGSVSKELRGMAIELNVPVVSAVQVNRAGFKSSEIDLTDTSDSFGVPMNADAIFALSAPEELLKIGQMKVRHVKSRYMDKSQLPSWVVGIDYSKMKIFDVEDSAQENITEISDVLMDKPIMDEKFNEEEFDFEKFSI